MLLDGSVEMRDQEIHIDLEMLKVTDTQLWRSTSPDKIPDHLFDLPIEVHHTISKISGENIQLIQKRVASVTIHTYQS